MTVFCITFSVVDFFNRINLLYGTICEYCTDQTCPTMSGGPRYVYMHIIHVSNIHWSHTLYDKI